MSADNKDIVQILKSKEISPSLLRIEILRYFLEHHNHPNVNMIWEYLQPLIPTISKTSVYNTLALFLEKKIIENLGFRGNEQRYDLYRSHPHAHFYCTDCDRFFDMNINIDSIVNGPFREFDVEQNSVQFEGICPECKKKNK